MPEHELKPQEETAAEQERPADAGDPGDWGNSGRWGVFGNRPNFHREQIWRENQEDENQRRTIFED